MKIKTLAHFSAAAACVAAFSVSAFAADTPGYVTDTRGDIVRSGFGLCWRTNSWTPAMAIKECDPDLVAVAAPAAAPPVANISFEADGFFDFGKSSLLPDGKRRLAAFAGALRNSTYSKVMVTGHTDRIGSAKNNQKLSQQRADTVKAFLMSERIDGMRITAAGKGSAEPKTGGSCTNKNRKALIACLAPDRRLEVAVTQ
jgi:OOP family OmpA-OmpF porin